MSAAHAVPATRSHDADASNPGTTGLLLHAYQKPENRGGLERTNDIVFANDGKTLYVVDYGELYVDFSMPSPFFQTPKSSVIWKVTYTGN